MNKTVVVAIVAIVVLEVIAIAKGMNGAALTSSVGLIAGLGGYAVRVKRDKK